LEEDAPPRKRIKIRVSSASKAAKSEFAPSFGKEEPASLHEDDMRQVVNTHVISPHCISQFTQQVELMLYAFDGSPSLDKANYLCPGALPLSPLYSARTASHPAFQATFACVLCGASSKHR
jgi:hypothetical protein